MLLDSALRVVSQHKADKAETAALFGLAVAHDPRLAHRADRAKVLLERLVGCVEGEVAHKDRRRSRHRGGSATARVSRAGRVSVATRVARQPYSFFFICFDDLFSFRKMQEVKEVVRVDG